MKKSSGSGNQIVIISNLYQNLPRLLLMAGWLFVVVGMLGIGVLQQMVSTPQDFRTQAVNPDGQVTIRFDANPISVNSGQNIVFTGYINTRSVPTDGVQLVLLLPKSSVSSAPNLSLIANSGLQIGLNQVINKGNAYELQFIALPSTIGQPFITTTEIPFLKIQGTANSQGSYQLSADFPRSLVTRFRSNPVIDELAPIMSVDYTVISSNPPPTATPTSPVGLPSNTPTPPLSGSANTLSLAFKLQGLKRSNQQLEGVVYLQSNSSILERQDSDAVSIVYELPTKFISTQFGVLTPIERMRLNRIPIAPSGTTYDVFVKTQFSLRKKLGSLVLKPGNNIAPSEWAQIQLKTGDFWQRPRAEWNVLNLRDISQILSVYTQLQVPVTSLNAQFDVNFDQIIDIMDVAIVLSNYTQLEVRGD